jgi:hypothetical protein
MNLTERMYKCLLSYPCRCQMKWQNAELVVIARCSRCQIIEEYCERQLEVESVT